MTKFFKFLISHGIFTLLSPSITYSAEQSTLKDLSEPAYLPQIQIGSYYANHQQSYATSSFLIPLLQQDKQLFFGDIHLLGRTDKSFEGNFGLGYRQWDVAKNSIYGVYGFYDRRRSKNNNYFNQITLGGELKFLQSSFGGNIYLPLGSNHYTSTKVVPSLIHNSSPTLFDNIMLSQATEKIMPGCDVEVGYHFAKIPKWTNYVGAYYFKAPNLPVRQGPRIRSVYTFDQLMPVSLVNRFSVEMGLQHDKPRGSLGFIGINLSFGGVNNAIRENSFALHMVDRVNRDLDVITHYNPQGNQHLAMKNNAPINIGFATDNKSLSDAIDNGADVIAVRGDINELSTIHLHDGQTLTGGSYQIGDLTMQLSEHGRLGATMGSDLIEVGKNNSIRDIELNVATGQNAIRNTIATDNTLAEPSSIGQGVGNLTIDHVYASGGFHFHVDESATNSNFTLRHNTIAMGDVSNSAGIYIAAKNNAEVNVTSVSGNLIQFNGEASRNSGILLTAFGTNQNVNNENTKSTININQLNANTVDYHLSGGNGENKGISIGGAIGNEVTNSVNHETLINVNSLSDNLINYTGVKNYDGYDNTGISLINDAQLDYKLLNANNTNTLIVGSVDHNQINFSNAGNVLIGIGNLLGEKYDDPSSYLINRYPTHSIDHSTQTNLTKIGTINSNQIKANTENNVQYYAGVGIANVVYAGNHSVNGTSNSVMEVQSISDNLIQFNAQNEVKGISNYVETNNSLPNSKVQATLTINKLNTNLVSLSNGEASIGLVNDSYIYAPYQNNSEVKNQIVIDELNGNQFNFANSSNNFGVMVLQNSYGYGATNSAMHNTLAINNMLENKIVFTNGERNTGVFISANTENSTNNSAVSELNIGTIANNILDFANTVGKDNTAFSISNKTKDQAGSSRINLGAIDGVQQNSMLFNKEAEQNTLFNIAVLDTQSSLDLYFKGQKGARIIQGDDLLSCASLFNTIPDANIKVKNSGDTRLYQ